MNELQLHAERELKLLAGAMPDSTALLFLKEILALCEAFSKSDLSTYWAPYASSIISTTIKRLMMHETLSPLTGEDSEWIKASEDYGNNHLLQNNRDGRVFKEGVRGKAYFTEAISFKDGPNSFYGKNIETYCGTVGSTQLIKSFPFTPETFTVDVISHRSKNARGETGNWWPPHVKDEKQLDEAFEYYDRMKDSI